MKLGQAVAPAHHLVVEGPAIMPSAPVAVSVFMAVKEMFCGNVPLCAGGSVCVEGPVVMPKVEVEVEGISVDMIAGSAPNDSS